MRKLSEIDFDLDMVRREMAQIVIRQSDDDEKLARLDRRLSFLEKEKAVLIAKELF